MYLFKKNNGKSISVYSFLPDSERLKEFKRNHINEIKSVSVIVANPNTAEILLSSPTIMFDALDRREDNGDYSFIQVSNDKEVVSKYINGDFDCILPLSIIGGAPLTDSRYCGDIKNEDATLLYESGGYNRSTLVINKAVLLRGLLDSVQPLLTGNINNLLFPDNLMFLEPESDEFFNLCTCTKEKVISLDNLRFMEEAGLISFNDDVEETFEKSISVLDAYHRARKRRQ